VQFWECCCSKSFEDYCRARGLLSIGYEKCQSITSKDITKRKNTKSSAERHTPKLVVFVLSAFLDHPDKCITLVTASQAIAMELIFFQSACIAIKMFVILPQTGLFIPPTQYGKITILLSLPKS
jgi:hypothetical protein